MSNLRKSFIFASYQIRMRVFSVFLLHVNTCPFPVLQVARDAYESGVEIQLFGMARKSKGFVFDAASFYHRLLVIHVKTGGRIRVCGLVFLFYLFDYLSSRCTLAYPPPSVPSRHFFSAAPIALPSLDLPFRAQHTCVP